MDALTIVLRVGRDRAALPVGVRRAPGRGWLVYAQIEDALSPDPRYGFGPVPATLLGYGIVSLVGAIGMWLERRWAVLLVIVSQGFVALGLAALALTRFPDWSLWAVAAIAGGAALCAWATTRVAA